VAQAFWESLEHRHLQVQALYRAWLERTAEPGALAYWSGLLQTGQSEQQVEAAILASPEYTQKHPDPVSFVSGLYGSVLGRPLDAAGAAFWEQTLRSGVSRPALAAGMLSSFEAMARTLAQIYAAYLRRPLDPAGAQYWVPLALAAARPTEAAALAILSSDEYLQIARALTHL